VTAESLRVHEAGKPQLGWTLHLYPNGLRATPDAGGADVHLLRDEAAKAWRLGEAPWGGAFIVMKKPARVSWQATDEVFDRAARWLGYAPALKMALANRLSWTVPIGLLFVLTSFPLEGNPGKGVAPIPFNPVSALLGAFLLVQGIVSRFVPHRVFFALDTIWVVALIAQNLAGIAAGASPFWLVLVVFQVFLALSGWRLFRRYDPSRPAWREADPASPPRAIAS
jgi:hypothetical protein